MSQEIEDFVNDILGDLGDKMQEFLEERDQEYKERAKMGVKIEDSWNGYDTLIGGHRIHIEHDTSMHKWHFKDENYHTFFEISERKGEAIVQFLKELAKVLSPRSTAASEETFSQDTEDPEAENDEIIGERPLGPESSGEDSLDEEEFR